MGRKKDTDFLTVTILRSETKKIAASLPDAEMVIVPGEDHGSYIVGSEIMGRLLLDFLKRNWKKD